MLFTIEIDQNLVALSDYWARFQVTRQTALALAQMPLPAWRTTVWETQTSVMAMAFDELTLSRLVHIYGSLSDISTFHAQLALIHHQDHLAEASAPQAYSVFGRPTGTREFVVPRLAVGMDDDLLGRWTQLVTGTLATANPLRKKTPDFP